MSDVLGPSSFQGIFFVFASALAALVFVLVFLVNLFTWQRSSMASAALVVAVNLLAAYLMFNSLDGGSLGGKPAKFADYTSPIWFALSIAGFFYLRKRLTASRQSETREHD